jgi:hypothetical protein
MGLDKSGTHTIAGSYTKITGWVFRAGCPETDLFNDGIRVTEGLYDIEGKFTMDSSRASKIRLMKNGSTVLVELDLTSGSNPTALQALLGQVALVDGDQITLEGYATATKTIQAGSTNTYLTVTPTPDGPVAMGIYKNRHNPQNIPGTSVPTAISGITTMSGYPSTKESPGGFTLRAGTYNLAGRLEFGSTSTMSAKIFKNETEIATASGSIIASPTASSISANGTDVFTLRGANNQGENVMDGPGFTYLTATPV